jgi:hypothetical protein
VTSNLFVLRLITATAEQLLRTAVASGSNDKRVRQNLALVLGVQGKFDEARKIASSDLPEADAKANMAYLKNMLSAPTNVASLGPDDGAEEVEGAEWEPYAENEQSSMPVRTAMAGPAPIQARTVETPLTRRSAAAEKGDRIASAPAAAAPAQGSGSTTVAKTPTVAAANVVRRRATSRAFQMLRRRPRRSQSDVGSGRSDDLKQSGINICAPRRSDDGTSTA